MNEKEQTLRQLKQILIDDLFVSIPENEIKPKDSLEDLGVDSVGLVELTTLLEDKYGIKIDEGEVTRDNFRTLDQLSNFIVAKTAGGKPVGTAVGSEPGDAA
jgi:acyl carrier protein